MFSLSPFAPENMVSRDRFGRPVPRLYDNTTSPTGTVILRTDFVGKRVRDFTKRESAKFI